MSWEEMKPWQLHVRKYGVKQFIKLYNRLKVGVYIIRGQTVFQTEAVPSINYIGRQLDVSYIGREMYGEIVFCSNAFFHELSVSEYCPTINTYICDPYRRKKRESLLRI